MYGGVGFRHGVIGDVDVLKVGSTYHLFHLVLPNHSYIAHAVSSDGLTWEAAPHALHISDPGQFDDDMLWTMHVTPDPDRPGCYRMFYTGLSRADGGRVQRIGCALSDDLIHWRKLMEEDGYPYPVNVNGPWYEAERPENRLWRSFRDPYFYHDPETGDRLLLVCGRVNQGPMIRRGCVVTARENERDEWEFIEPLHQPGVYDEIEVPGVFKLDGRYYLIGSIREDVKVRYWFSDNLMGPYENFFDNTLLPQGNYAARPGFGDGQLLLWNFFYQGNVGGPKQYLPPPKALAVDATGRLRLKSFNGFDSKVVRNVEAEELTPLEPLRENPYAAKVSPGTDGWLGCGIGFEAFTLRGDYDDVRLRATLSMNGRGKTGLVFRMDDEGNGYYFSLDLVKGLAQARGWGENGHHADFGLPPEQGFAFEPLQTSNFISDPEGPWDLELIGFGRYMELSINGFIVLTFADDRYSHGRMGFYVEGSRVRIEHVSVEVLRSHGDMQPVHLPEPPMPG